MLLGSSIPILNVVLCSSFLGILGISVGILFTGVTSCFGIPKSFGLSSGIPILVGSCRGDSFTGTLLSTLSFDILFVILFI